LLDHLTPDNDALKGDLIEQFLAGRTRLWYWRQVLLAIVVHAAADIRAHKLLTVRAAIVGTAILLACVKSTLALYLWMSHQWVNAWANESRAWLVNWHYFGGHLHLVWCLGAVLSGWLVVRLHWRHPAAAILTAVASQLPWVAWWGLPIWIRTWDQPQFPWTVAHQMIAAFILIGMPLCTLLGGLWAASIDDATGDENHDSNLAEATP
jgi:hypothetical protein